LDNFDIPLGPAAKDPLENPADSVSQVNLAEELINQLGEVDLTNPDTLDQGTAILKKIAEMCSESASVEPVMNLGSSLDLQGAAKICEIRVQGPLQGMDLSLRGDLIATASKVPNSDELEVRILKLGYELQALTARIKSDWGREHHQVQIKFSGDDSTLAVQTNQQTAIFALDRDSRGLPQLADRPILLDHSLDRVQCLALSNDGAHFVRVGVGPRHSKDQKYSLEYGRVDRGTVTTVAMGTEPILSAAFVDNGRFIYSSREKIKEKAGLFNLYARLAGDGTVDKMHSVVREYDLLTGDNVVKFSERNLPDLYILSIPERDSFLALHARGLLKVQQGKATVQRSFKAEEILPEQAVAAEKTVVIPERIYEYAPGSYGGAWSSGQQLSRVFRSVGNGAALVGTCIDRSVASTIDSRELAISANGSVVSIQGKSGKSDVIGVFRV
jgi:hypothetical protein